MRIYWRPGDAAHDDALGQVMYDAIHIGNPHYTRAERTAWLPAPNAGPAWSARLEGQRVLVADMDDRIAGFISLERDLIDLAFVAPRVQGQGVFSALYAKLEDFAEGTRLRTFASLAAQPAFEAQGFHVIRHETVARGTQRLRRAEMEKVLK
ncbi:GNAT family N-acetyltransferase [Sulfitobacter sp. HNIBRBA3233]|uniref:GNAT family N-acetyltransferase n=1 Tax=Sulfitobacter marinivivus TaxID=3158558 RepID=UPI0032DFC08B